MRIGPHTPLDDDYFREEKEKGNVHCVLCFLSSVWQGHPCVACIVASSSPSSFLWRNYGLSLLRRRRTYNGRSRSLDVCGRKRNTRKWMKGSFPTECRGPDEFPLIYSCAYFSLFCLRKRREKKKRRQT